MKTEIKNLRIQIDGLAQLTKELKPKRIRMAVGDIGFSTTETDAAKTSLYLAKAWLGKMLGEIGECTPYFNDGNRHSILDIEDTADKAVPNLLENMEVFCKKPWSEKSHIEKVDWIREEIKKIIDTTADFSETYPEIGLEQGFVYKYLCEARFWLGFELERLRNEK